MARNYTKEFKINICELVIKDNISPQVIGERFGISHIMVYRRVNEYRANPETFVGKGHVTQQDKELQKAKRRIRDLGMRY